MTPIILAALFTCTQPGVIDGDTWRCADGARVRAWGIDAPERYTPAGPASTAALARLITGKTLTREPRGKSYNRTVALCRLPNGTDIGGEMIRQGRAVEWCSYSRNFYGDCK